MGITVVTLISMTSDRAAGRQTERKRIVIRLEGLGASQDQAWRVHVVKL
jgi:hypothetical protein